MHLGASLAATLARWAHLALVRKTFRRTAREAAYEKAIDKNEFKKHLSKPPADDDS